MKNIMDIQIAWSDTKKYNNQHPKVKYNNVDCFNSNLFNTEVPKPLCSAHCVSQQPQSLKFNKINYYRQKRLLYNIVELLVFADREPIIIKYVDNLFKQMYLQTLMIMHLSQTANGLQFVKNYVGVFFRIQIRVETNNRILVCLMMKTNRQVLRSNWLEYCEILFSKLTNLPPIKRDSYELYYIPLKNNLDLEMQAMQFLTQVLQEPQVVPSPSELIATSQTATEQSCLKASTLSQRQNGLVDPLNADQKTAESKNQLNETKLKAVGPGKKKAVGESVGDFGTESGSKLETGQPEQVSSEKLSEVQDSPSEQRCFNRFCSSSGSLKLLRSRIQNLQISLCRQCFSSYSSNMFCTYCQQIYFKSQTVDGEQWVKCQQCERKNHLKCEKQANRISLLYGKYLCGTCQSKRKRRRNKDQMDRDLKQLKKKANRQSIPQSNRMQIFTKTTEVYSYLDCFLMGCGYKLALPDDQVLRDVMRMTKKTTEDNFLINNTFDITPPRKKRKF